MTSHDAHQGGAPAGGGAARLRVRLTPSSSGDELRQRLEASLPPHLQGVVQGVVQHEDEILRWLAEDDDRAAAFLVDPVATLRESGIGFQPGAIDTLAREAGGARPRPPAPGPRIRSVSVTTKRPSSG